MPVLEENTKNETKKIFEKLVAPVKLVVITDTSDIIVPGRECVTCKDNQTFIEEVATLSDKISVTVYDFLKDKEKISSHPFRANSSASDWKKHWRSGVRNSCLVFALLRKRVRN